MNNDVKALIDKLETDRTLSRAGYLTLLENQTPEATAYLFDRARAGRQGVYGTDVYMRGLIEFTNYCRNDCYCGIRKSNRDADRYRLTQEQILECCAAGHKLGFRTFVLQGGEDPFSRTTRSWISFAPSKGVSRLRRDPVHRREAPRKLSGLFRRGRRALPAPPRDGQRRPL